MGRVFTKKGGTVGKDAEETTDVIPGVGILTRWRTGEPGGASECCRATLKTEKPLTSESLREVAESFHLRAGSPFRELEPRSETTEDGLVYTWVYHPSTD